MAMFDGGAGYLMSAMSRTRRQPPPHPLGDDFPGFPYGAATPRASEGEMGSPGWEGCQVKVRPPNGRTVYLSGDAVQGTVLVGRKPEGVPQDAQGTLDIKLYFESRTLYYDDERAFAETKKMSKTGQEIASMPIGDEWHRGIAAAFTVPVASASPTSVPFSVPLPATMTIEESSSYTDAKGQRRPPRKSCDVPRSPPPTLRDFSNGSVEWVVEAVLTYDPTTVHQVDEKGFLLSTPPKTFVSRAVFPFLPRDEHLLPLLNFTSPASGHSFVVPTFGPDPLSRFETNGASLVPSPQTDQQALLIKKAIEAGRLEDLPKPDPLRWTKDVHLEGKLGMSGGVVKVVTQVPEGGRFERTAKELVLHLSLDFGSGSAVGGGKLFSKLLGNGKAKASHQSGEDAGADPGKGKLGRIGITVAKRSLTRGGREEEGHPVLEELRRADYLFPPLKSTKAAADVTVAHGGIQVEADGEAGEGKVALKVKLDMQSGGTIVKRQRSHAAPAAGSGGAQAGKNGSDQVPIKTVVPSFRTPNIEVEYVVTVNVVPINQPLFCTARFPLQILTGPVPSSTSGSSSSSAGGNGAIEHPVVAIGEGELPPDFERLNVADHGGEELPEYGR